MGTTTDDFEQLLRDVAEDVSRGVRPEPSLKCLVYAVADLLAGADAVRMRQAAARLSGFMRVTLGTPPQAGPAGVLLLGAHGGTGDLTDLTLLAAKETDRVQESTAQALAADDGNWWRNETSNAVGILLHLLRHVSAAADAASSGVKETAARATLDDRVRDLVRDEGRPIRSGDVARRLGVDAAQASRSLRRLVSAGLVTESTRVEGDARARWFVAPPRRPRPRRTAGP